MEINEIINDIEQSHCMNCKFGKALSALQGLNETDPVAAIKPDKSRSLNENLLKSVRKTGHGLKPGTAKKSSPSEKKANCRAPNGKTVNRIMEYLSGHPGKTKVEIARNLTLPETTVGFHLMNLRRSGKATLDGWNWSLIVKLPAVENQTPAERIDDDPTSVLQCKLCNSICASEERLKKHMQVVHGK